MKCWQMLKCWKKLKKIIEIRTVKNKNKKRQINWIRSTSKFDEESFFPALKYIMTYMLVMIALSSYSSFKAFKKN